MITVDFLEHIFQSLSIKVKYNIRINIKFIEKMDIKINKVNY